MSKYTNMRGVLRKIKGANGREYTGHIKVNGERFSVSGYEALYENGAPFLSLRIRPMDAGTSEPGSPVAD